MQLVSVCDFISYNVTESMDQLPQCCSASVLRVFCIEERIILRQRWSHFLPSDMDGCHSFVLPTCSRWGSFE